MCGCLKSTEKLLFKFSLFTEFPVYNICLFRSLVNGFFFVGPQRNVTKTRKMPDKQTARQTQPEAWYFIFSFLSPAKQSLKKCDRFFLWKKEKEASTHRPTSMTLGSDVWWKRETVIFACMSSISPIICLLFYLHKMLNSRKKKSPEMVFTYIKVNVWWKKNKLVMDWRHKCKPSVSLKLASTNMRLRRRFLFSFYYQLFILRNCLIYVTFIVYRLPCQAANLLSRSFAW